MKLFLTGTFLSLALLLTACSKNEAPKVGDAAADKKQAVATADDPTMVKVSVPTIQCETCAKTIKGEVSKITDAKEINVNVEEKTVFVKVANNSPELRKQIETAIAKAGYNTTTMKRDDAAYNALPDCCKEGGMQ